MLLGLGKVGTGSNLQYCTQTDGRKIKMNKDLPLSITIHDV